MLDQETISILRALAREALLAGDRFQADLCIAAISGDMAALIECIAVIGDAKAQVAE